MNFHVNLKTLALLCALPLSHAFAAKPANPAMPASLEEKFAGIDAMSDHEVLSKPLTMFQGMAERLLEVSKEDFKDNFPQVLALKVKEAERERLNNKYALMCTEIESCNDYVRKYNLKAQCERLRYQIDASAIEANKVIKSLIVSEAVPLEAYHYQIRRLNVFQNQAALLQAQKETEKAEWQQKEIQWQQERQSLLAQLAEYQPGQQIEGASHVPTGLSQR